MSKPICSTGLRWLWLVVVVLVLDFASKQWILGNFVLGQSQPLIPSFNLFYARNYGAAFSFLADHGGWQRWFFAGIAVAIVAVLLVLIITGFCGLILSPQHLSLLWPCLLGLGIGGLFPMSLILSLDHLDNPRRAGGLTAFVQGIGYLIAGLSPLIAGMIRDQLGSFQWAWWSLTAVIVVMLLIVTQFNPKHYAQHIR